MNKQLRTEGWLVPVGRVKLPVIFRSCSWLAVCGGGRFWPDGAGHYVQVDQPRRVADLIVGRSQ
jgi:hypothetical protein